MAEDHEILREGPDDPLWRDMQREVIKLALHEGEPLRAVLRPWAERERPTPPPEEWQEVERQVLAWVMGLIAKLHQQRDLAQEYGYEEVVGMWRLAVAHFETSPTAPSQGDEEARRPFISPHRLARSLVNDRQALCGKKLGVMEDQALRVHIRDYLWRLHTAPDSQREKNWRRVNKISLELANQPPADGTWSLENRCNDHHFAAVAAAIARQIEDGKKEGKVEKNLMPNPAWVEQIFYDFCKCCRWEATVMEEGLEEPIDAEVIEEWMHKAAAGGDGGARLSEVRDNVRHCIKRMGEERGRAEALVIHWLLDVYRAEPEPGRLVSARDMYHSAADLILDVLELPPLLNAENRPLSKVEYRLARGGLSPEHLEQRFRQGLAFLRECLKRWLSGQWLPQPVHN